MSALKKCSPLPQKVLSYIVLVTVIIFSVSAFNLSPKPNLVLAKLKLTPKERSSYFGFSVVLRKTRLVFWFRCFAKFK